MFKTAHLFKQIMTIADRHWFLANGGLRCKIS